MQVVLSELGLPSLVESEGIVPDANGEASQFLEWEETGDIVDEVVGEVEVGYATTRHEEVKSSLDTVVG